MCGITLIINKTKSANKLATNRTLDIIKILKNRGPDDYGIFADNERGIYMIHTLLATQDTQNIIHQPYVLKSTYECVIIFNGEIYNYRSLAKEYDIESIIDTDFIMKLYISHKVDFFNIINKFIGIYCFVILDQELNKAYIVRDSFGVKPLYYVDTDEVVVYTQNINVIYLFCPKNIINNPKVIEYFYFRQCLNNETILDNVHSVKPGYFVTYDLTYHSVTNTKYYNLFLSDISDISDNSNTNDTDDTTTSTNYDKLELMLNKSIELNMLTDETVKLGCFVSGGVDSSYIYKICSNHKNINTYSIGFENCNEFEYVNKVIMSQQVDNNHHNITINMGQYIGEMIELINYKGYLLQVPNEVLISIIAKRAKHDGIKVMLCGEGADEIYHGYGKIFSMYLDKTVNSANFIDKFINKYKYIKNNKIFNSVDHISNPDDEQYIHDHFNTYYEECKPYKAHIQDIISYIFIRFHLVGLVERLDAATMYNSIEARVPFLNQDLVNYVFNKIDRTDKIKRSYSEDTELVDIDNPDLLSEVHDIPKYCLKKIAEKVLTNDIVYRKKVGFTVPIEDINDPHINIIIRRIITNGSIRNIGLFNMDILYSTLFGSINTNTDIKYIIFNLINLEMYYQLHIDKKTLRDVNKFFLMSDELYQIKQTDQKIQIIGYTCGVYDLFHTGHVNILKQAKKHCDYLIVAITTDQLAQYKGKKPIISQQDRKDIIESTKYADVVIYQTNIDKFEAWTKYKFDILFVGDDWKDHSNWIKWEQQLNDVGSTVMYIPYTKHVSSTLIRNKMINQT